MSLEIVCLSSIQSEIYVELNLEKTFKNVISVAFLKLIFVKSGICQSSEKRTYLNGLSSLQKIILLSVVW